MSLRGSSRFELLLLRMLLEELEGLELAVLLLIAECGRLRLVFSSSS
jgi:hypothetical protein